MTRLTPPVGAGDHTVGPADALITLVEYGDYECPYCLMAHPIVRAARRRLGNRMRFVFRNFPLKQIHPHAQHAAEAAEAAAAQGRFWEMHDVIFENQYALEDADLLRYGRSIGLDTARLAHDLEAGTFTARVRDDFRSGVRSGVNGTPTFFIDGERYDGTWTDEGAFIRSLRDAVDRRLRNPLTPGNDPHAATGEALPSR
ncbi:MAG TPA: thioredoxin domain-containing protein [Gemmatimonadaceae bacterium]|nr:thioredoxin domain-containing protein [Gemmatimonadaceae bacterium]